MLARRRTAVSWASVAKYVLDMGRLGSARECLDKVMFDVCYDMSCYDELMPVMNLFTKCQSSFFRYICQLDDDTVERPLICVVASSF